MTDADADPGPGASEVGASEAGSPGGLSERDRAVLALERRSWPSAGVKERVIREQLDMSPTRYYQLLNVLLDDPAALAHDPVAVNRLRRLRETRRANR
jgi:hypothetical protein